MTSGRTTPEHILRQIRRLRRQSQMSLAEISRHVGVHESVVRRALQSEPGDVVDEDPAADVEVIDDDA